MAEKDGGIPGGFGLLVAPVLFGLHLSLFVDEHPADGGAPGGRQRYEVWVRCPGDVIRRERLHARSPGAALAGAEALNPGCEALPADTAGSG